MRVLYFGTYDSDYARNWVLINGLKVNGVDVIELRRKPGRMSLFKLFFDYLKFDKKFDAMVVGFPGQEVMFLARFLTILRPSLRQVKPIIFDVFTSHYGGYILDRQKFPKNSLRSKYYRFLDKWSCKLADVVLLDTEAHIKFFVKEFNLPRKKFRRIWVGVPGKNVGNIIEKHVSDKFKIFFFGTYIPLQGVEYIIKAAKILEGQSDIVLTLIGSGQEKKKVENLAKEIRLKNVIFRGMVALENLRQEMADSDVCLGIFGTSPKTSLVIPNKIYEAVALRKPVITADTEAVRELFDENEILFVPKADARAIANAVIKLKSDKILREKLAANAYKKFTNLLTYQVLGKELKNILLAQLKSNDQRSSLSG